MKVKVIAGWDTLSSKIALIFVVIVLRIIILKAIELTEMRKRRTEWLVVKILSSSPLQAMNKIVKKRKGRGSEVPQIILHSLGVLLYVLCSNSARYRLCGFVFPNRFSRPLHYAS